MLDRAVVADLLKDWMKDEGIKLPRSIKFKSLVEAFCQYTEDDYYEWLKDNYESFFGHEEIDWNEIKKRIAKVAETNNKTAARTIK